MSDRRLRAAIAALATLGAGIAAYLTYTRLAHVRIACVSSGCETVQSSSYSEVAGIPVAAIGLAGYVVLAASAGFRSDLARAAGATAALAGLGVAAYLLYVQLAIIGAVCQWCLASDAILVALVPATILRVAAGERVASPPIPG